MFFFGIHGDSVKINNAESLLIVFLLNFKKVG
jgi:hypothetical protein